MQASLLCFFFSTFIHTTKKKKEETHACSTALLGDIDLISAALADLIFALHHTLNIYKYLMQRRKNHVVQTHHETKLTFPYLYICTIYRGGKCHNMNTTYGDTTPCQYVNINNSFY